MKSTASFVFLFLLVCTAMVTRASHIIGAEIGYTHVAGLTYEITLTIYGDCAGSSFPTLPSAVPRIKIYKNNVPFSFIDLAVDGPGVEVTPVCPAEINNTTCVSATGTLPGVMRFVYKGTAVLDGPASNWLFQFNSSFGTNYWAGRSFSITNITNPSQMALEATLNNMAGQNNSSLFSTIPTPFFCINTLQEYNQGAVDPDGDQLSFALVPGLDADNTGTVTGNVTYIAPYTYLNPLATVPGSFNFNTSNGQMSFTPNLVQTSLVVNKVTETRAGVVVGTAMREMNLVVLNNCTNQPPPVSLPSSNVGTFDSLTHTLTICNSTPFLHFEMSAADPDSQHVTITVTGLPAGATASISGNGSLHPQVQIDWTLPQPIVPGSYTFYINSEDDGCPLKSKQTIAYTVIIVQPVSFSANTQQESCVPGADGSIQLTGLTGTTLQFSLNGGGFQSSPSFTGLTAGAYTVTAQDAQGCFAQQVFTVPSSPKPIVTIAVDPESCSPGNDGSVSISANSSNGGITGYSINGGAFQVGSTFSNLSAGIYLIQVQDVAGCLSTTQALVTKAIIPQITQTNIQQITCHGSHNGNVKVSVSPSSSNYTYYLLPTSSSNQTGVFSALGPGTYTLIVKSDKNCRDSVIVNITEPPVFRFTDLQIQSATCDKNNAQLFVKTNYSGTLIYTLRPATVINTTGVFTDITSGVYTISVRDSNFCEVDSVITIGSLPKDLRADMFHQDLSCNGYGTEGSAEVKVSGGIGPYTYLWSTEPPSYDSKVSGLYYGWYFVSIVDATGCEIQDTVYIQPGSCCENIYIPNAFSPNNDGQNDTWRLITSAGISIEQFAVFDRWGNEVWRTKDQRKVWDGQYHGKEVSEGTFFYLLRYKCLQDGKSYERKGDIMVLR
jgi:gliding motility-associated-like protein